MPCPARALLLIVLAAGSLRALSKTALCSSDAQPTPTAVLERVINADCESCWRDSQTPAPAPGGLALDWIAPGSLGDDAPLAAAATRDTTDRLAALARARPARAAAISQGVRGWPGSALRVAHGVAVGDYVGVSVRLTIHEWGAVHEPVQPWVALVEALPAGTEGSPAARNLVRNVLKPLWDMRHALSMSSPTEFYELRPMNLGAGVLPERVRVVAWLEDASGQILTAAHSHCPTEEAP